MKEIGNRIGRKAADNIKDYLPNITLAYLRAHVKGFNKKYQSDNIGWRDRNQINNALCHEIERYVNLVKCTIESEDDYFCECDWLRRRYEFGLPRYKKLLGHPDDETAVEVLLAYEGNLQRAFDHYSKILTHALRETRDNTLQIHSNPKLCPSWVDLSIDREEEI